MYYFSGSKGELSREWSGSSGLAQDKIELENECLQEKRTEE